MRLVYTHRLMDYIISTISDIDSMIDSLVKPYENVVHLLRTTPVVDCNSTITIISEVSTNMTPFSYFKPVYCTSLSPGNSESGDKKNPIYTCRCLPQACIV